jgi:hypothetical protein
MEASLSTRGAIYFLVAYLDRALRIPRIETYFCVVHDAAEKVWYFQGAESFVEKGLLSIEQAAGSDDCLGLRDEDVVDAALTWDALVKELAENKAMQDRGMSFAQRGQLT